MKLTRLALFAPFIAAPAFAEEAGMPQMDPTWFLNQLFWLAVSFTVLYIIISRMVVPGVGGVLKRRADAIEGAIAEAERVKAVAGSTRSDFEAAGSSARAQAAELMAHAQAEASREASEASAKISADIERKLERAEARIADALKAASGEVDGAVKNLAEAMATKLLAKGA